MTEIIKFRAAGWNCRVALDYDERGNECAAVYSYDNERAEEDAIDEEHTFLGFKFTLLSEVGEFLVEPFRRALKDAGYRISGVVQFSWRPWLSDRIVRTKRLKNK